MSVAVFFLVVGLLMGSIFTFGMQYWNDEVNREDCHAIETEFLSHKEIRRLKRFYKVREISVDCSNGNRYFIDGECVNAELQDDLENLSEGEPITLLIHPNSNTIVAFSTDEAEILNFDDAITQLDHKSTAFLFLGLFLYFCAAIGLFFTIRHLLRKYRAKNS